MLPPLFLRSYLLTIKGNKRGQCSGPVITDTQLRHDIACEVSYGKDQVEAALLQPRVQARCGASDDGAGLSISGGFPAPGREHAFSIQWMKLFGDPALTGA